MASSSTITSKTYTTLNLKTNEINLKYYIRRSITENLTIFNFVVINIKAILHNIFKM